MRPFCLSELDPFRSKTFIILSRLEFLQTLPHVWHHRARSTTHWRTPSCSHIIVPLRADVNSVQACDEYGNKRKQGGDAFKASIRGLDADAASITDRGNGSYALRYCLPSEGAFSLCVTGPDGRHLRGSPATLTAFR